MTNSPPSQDCLRSTLALEHSPKWKMNAELSLDPRLFPEGNLSHEVFSLALGKS